MTKQLGQPTGKEALWAPDDSVIGRLRQAVPKGLNIFSYIGASRVAAQQANLLRQLAHTADALPEELILDRVHLRIDRTVPADSTYYWDNNVRQWVIVLHERLSPKQRRYCALREFKHIVDYRDQRLYDPDQRLGPVEAELASEYFARCGICQGG